MKTKSLNVTTGGLLVTALCCVGSSVSADQARSGESAQIPAGQVHYVSSGIKQHGGEIFIGSGYGDYKSGKHGTFLKFTPGFHSLLHTHTYDYYAVVIKGVVENPVKGEKDTPQLPPGSYWYQKGGQPHWTNCVSKTECIVFLVSDGKWDAQVLEKE
jgi:quercetin dioxygenase-like cupin family protein